MNKILLLIIFFLGSFGLTYLYLRWAIKRSILDIPNERSSHLIPVPRGGGIVFILLFYIAITVLLFHNQIEKKLFFALIPGLFLAIIGFIDDYKSLAPLLRFVVQFLCAGVSLYLLGGFQVPFLNDYQWLWSLIALVGIVWFTNLFNFLDGSDGYASMEALSISIGIFLFTGSIELIFLASVVGGFLYWNLPKARLFMGDSGSITLGFIFAIFAIYLNNSNLLDISIWLVLTMLFWYDATVTLMRRVLNMEKLSVAHKKHMYQRAVQSGFSHFKVMIIGASINVVLIIVSYLSYLESTLYLPGLFFSIVILSLIMRYVDKRVAFDFPNINHKHNEPI